jgi:hypothetical protein
MWPWMQGVVADDSSPGDECQAFVSGRYAEFASVRRRPVPVWAWVNTLAHGSEQDLATLASGPSDVPWWCHRRDRNFGRAISYLADVLLGDVLVTGTALATIQRSILEPLESRLIDEERAWELTPERLIGVVLACLRGHPSSKRW